MDQVYRLFDRRCRTDTALEKLAELRRRVKRFKKVGKTLQKLDSPNLEKALAFLDDKLLPATSNAVERGNRRHRKMQKTVYRVRTKKSLERRMALDLLREMQAADRGGTDKALHRARSPGRFPDPPPRRKRERVCNAAKVSVFQGFGTDLVRAGTAPPGLSALSFGQLFLGRHTAFHADGGSLVYPGFVARPAAAGVFSLSLWLRHRRLRRRSGFVRKRPFAAERHKWAAPRPMPAARSQRGFLPPRGF